MRVCFLFPGQGSQYPGMAKDLYEASAEVRELFEAASETTSMDLKSLLFDSTEEDLKRTDRTQPAVTLANLASRLVMEREAGVKSDGAAGHSLGEFSAMVDAGVVSVADCFRLVKARGELMETAGQILRREAADMAPGMAAVIGLSREDVEGGLAKVDGMVYVANHNSPTQTVIAGEAAALDAAESVLTEAGAGRYIRLKVSGPFHTPLLSEAGAKFSDVVEACEFKNPTKALFANVTGASVRTGAEAKQCAIQQITSPVSWVAEEQAILQTGFDAFYEVGPGTVLSGLWRAFTREAKCLPAGKLDQIRALGEDIAP